MDRRRRCDYFLLLKPRESTPHQTSGVAVTLRAFYDRKSPILIKKTNKKTSATHSYLPEANLSTTAARQPNSVGLLGACPWWRRSPPPWHLRSPRPSQPPWRCQQERRHHRHRAACAARQLRLRAAQGWAALQRCSAKSAQPCPAPALLSALQPSLRVRFGSGHLGLGPLPVHLKRKSSTNLARRAGLGASAQSEANANSASDAGLALALRTRSTGELTTGELTMRNLRN